MPSAPLTIGIEEEYQIIDPESRALTSFVQQMVERGRVVLPDQLRPEFMQSQIEVGSHICRNIHEARQEIIRLRRTVTGVAREHGRVIAAASTHPFSRWQEQDITEGERYKDLENEMQEVSRRLLIFGMHVHLGFGTTPEAFHLLIDVQNQMRYFLPHILALTTSSPFWQGRDSGFKSYRSIVFENMPRTGIPPIFNSYEDYRGFVDVLNRVGSLGDAKDSESADGTRIWWDVRPHPHFGTLEVRICDICTLVDEAVCIAALIQSVAAKLIKLRNHNQSWRLYRGALLSENKWRAARYGLDGKLIDFGISEEVPMRFLAHELLEVVDDVLDELGTRQDVEYVHTILESGTSADRQLATFRREVAAGASDADALVAVVDQVVAETSAGW